jgi:excisionase family DNA binding protein
MLLTPKKAAEFVWVDEATVLSWIADGRLAALKLDNQTTRVDSQDLARFLASRRALSVITTAVLERRRRTKGRQPLASNSLPASSRTGRPGAASGP